MASQKSRDMEAKAKAKFAELMPDLAREVAKGMGGDESQQDQAEATVAAIFAPNAPEE